MAWTPPEKDTVWTPPEKDSVVEPPHPSGALGQALYNAIAHAVKAASPFQPGPILNAATDQATQGAPGVVAGMTGQDLPADAPPAAQAARMVADPAVIGNMAAAAATGGSSLPVQVGMSALMTGSGRALQEGLRQAQASQDSTGAVLGEGAKAAAVAGGTQGLLGGIGEVLKSNAKSLAKFGASLIRVTSAVPEKYGEAVLSNPDILTEAPTLLGAKKIYADTIKDIGGKNDFLQKAAGKLLTSPATDMEMINAAFPKLDSGTLPLDEALAARQSASTLLGLAKMGNPEQMANKAALVQFKNQLDGYLDSAIPGFSDANKAYFEANARAAFEHFMPQNRNMSPNALRGLGMLSQISGAALMHSPALLMTAAASSPQLTGYAIRAAGPASIGATFAARVAATRATESAGSR